MPREFTIKLPEALVKVLEELGIDIEAKVIELLMNEINIERSKKAKLHAELAKYFLSEGKRLIDKDPVQASEKIYKAAEEAIKALTMSLGMENVLSKVEERGRWTTSDLERAVEALSDKLGKWLYDAWDHAWVLHVWGSHEAKLDSEAVRRRVKDVEMIIKEMEKLVKNL